MSTETGRTSTSVTGNDDRRWPALSASRTEPCDGVQPETERPCVLGHHGGYHRDLSGAEWLDD